MHQEKLPFSNSKRATVELRDRGIDRLPVNPIEIAEGLGLIVQPKPNTVEGVSGMLLRHNNTFGIMYATHIENEGFQRFSVSHELGHFLLEGHIDHIFPEGENAHVSYAGFVSSNVYELEADHFAVGLLMPDPLFLGELRRHSDGLAAVKGLAEKCRTSLTATAIRYIDKTSAPVAVIMSTGQHIDYCFMSKALRELDDLSWPRKGEPLPPGTETGRFNRDPNNVKRALEMNGEVNLRTWFGGRRSIKGIEEIIGLGKYGKTLTVVSSSERT